MKSIIVVCLLICNLSTAQSSVNSSGGEGIGSGGFVNYSVGEVAYSNYTGASGSIVEGIQFPYEIITLSNPILDTKIQLLVYPNPTSNTLTLKIQETTPNLEFQLFDSFGKLLESRKNLKGENQISVALFLSSIYFLKVHNEGKEIKVFKIIKN